jgi:hypothetical protein
MKIINRLLDKKAAGVMLIVMVGIGALLGYISFLVYDKISSPDDEIIYSEDILNQNIEIDLQINNLKYYLKKSAEQSVVKSLYSLSEKPKKIEEDPKHPHFLQTVRNKGYILWDH